MSTYVLYYSKFDQEVNAFTQVLTDWSLTRTQKQRVKPVGYSQKRLRSITRAFNYRVLVDNSNGVSQC